MASPTTTSTKRPRATGAPAGTDPPRTRQLVLSLGMVALGLGMAVNSVIGPLLVDAVDYPISDSMRNQTIGLDAAALFLFSPACLIAGVLAWRGHRLAPVLSLGLGSYAAYIFLQYVVGPEFERYPATLLLHLGLFIGGWTLTVYSWNIARRPLGPLPTLSNRHAAAAVLMAGFVVLRYVPGLVASLAQDPLPVEVAGDITMYWLIVVSDLGVFVPIAAATAVGIWRGAPWARLALVATVGWFTIVSVAVTAMALTMILNDDNYANAAQLGLFIVTTTIVAAYAANIHRGLLEDQETTWPPPTVDS